MHLIVIRKNENYSANRGSCLLRFAMSSKPIANIISDGLRASCCFNSSGDTMIAVPEEWRVESSDPRHKITYYDGNLPICLNIARKSKMNCWFIISNGRFVTSVDSQWLSKILAGRVPALQKAGKKRARFGDDLIAVNVDSALLSYREKVQITSKANVGGFRRLYSDSTLPAPIPTDWPHHIFVKLGVLDKILADGALPLTFAEFVSRCASSSLNWHCFKVGGTVLDLETEAGLLNLLITKLHSIHYHPDLINPHGYGRTNHADSCTVSANARIFGKVMLGDNVQIGDNVIIVGPTILGDNVKIATAAVIRASVIGPNLSVSKGRFVQNRILIGSKSGRNLLPRHSNIGVSQLNNTNSSFIKASLTNNNFRTWPRFSYARCMKRIADIIASLVVLTLFAPVLPVIAIVIKLSSPGRVLFKHKRQGLRGREFYCLKFRTMIVGADNIQEKLRFKNQADGPQFKVEDDPRVTAVGRFLRDTFIDEIPQFINILFGQMSVVGPRPSPKAENTLCPSWRDARLSVRPGITGLWQVFRTRRPGRDFQEWIYYDTKYVRNLSLRLDLLICWQTTKKLFANFIKQF